MLREFLGGCERHRSIWVRINTLDTGLAEEDIRVAVTDVVSGLILPKCQHEHDVETVASSLTHCEADRGLQEGSIRTMPVATETPQSMFRIQHIAKSSRIWGVTWGAEDLASALGAFGNMGPDGRLTPVFEHARTLCLLAARAANVEPIDTASMIMDDDAALRAECDRARFDGFTGKLAIHPRQVDIIHDAFTPSLEEIAHAEAVVAAFAEKPSEGALRLRGKMIDAPHLKAAHSILALAKQC
jgi:citrate lyase subunit beta / citryl-CoA lyase